MSEVIAILCSDIHLSHTSPVARSAEPDWYKAMKRSLDEVNYLSNEYECPVICAGDVFDRWNSPPELINFAIEYLPQMYAIPGQHDLPNHRLDEIGRSAYWTLAAFGKVVDLGHLADNEPVMIGDYCLHEFPWGVPVCSLNDGTRAIAVVHKYIWKKGFSYPGAPDGNKLSKIKKSLEGFDAAVFGDNHQGFISHWQQQDGSEFYLMNCGTLMRRKADEIDYRPQVGLLYSSGTIQPHYLDTSKDLFLEEHLARAKEKQELDVSSFIQELKSLGADSLDFRDAVKRYMREKNTDEDVREIVLESLESA